MVDTDSASQVVDVT